MILKKQMARFFSYLVLSLFCIVLYNSSIFKKQGSLSASGSCTVNYPIVMSHHWGMKKICEDGESDDCDNRAPAEYCAHWEPQGWFGYHCTDWKIPDNSEELNLPPRNTNMYDSTLTRETNRYYRYYRKDIKDRIEQCGNKVYFADKPAFASLQNRAKSLRNTVLEALNAPGETADKVIIIGMSMGCQDARYMAANLLVDDLNPAGPLMKEKVAAIVTVVGEAQGAGYSSLALDSFYVALYDAGLGTADWNNFSELSTWSEEKESLMDAAWKDPSGKLVLMEGEAPMADTPEDADEPLFKHSLTSLINLSVKYMSGTGMITLGFNAPNDWEALCSYVGMDERFWSDVVPYGEEENFDIEYYSYAAKIRNWNFSDWGDSLSQEYLFFMGIYSCCGDNDGYVTVDSQNLGNLGYSNFHHVKTLAGSWLGRGYHHMFFAGRNDDTLAPSPAYREDAPYDGGSADFYEQVLVNLNAAGF